DRADFAHGFAFPDHGIMADGREDAMPRDIALRPDLQPAPAVQDAHRREVRVVTDLDPALRIAGGDVRAGEKIDVVLDDQSPGRALDEAVGIEAHVRADARHRRAVLHEKAAVEAHVVSDLDALGVLDIDAVVDDDVLAAGLETLAQIVHDCGD